MDLLAIIQERINEKLTITRCLADHSTDCEPADTDNEIEIEATDVLIESASCTSGHDAYDAFSEPFLTVARHSPSGAIKNKYVMPENNREGSPKARQQMRPGSDPKVVWHPVVQSLVDWFLTLDPPTEPFYLENHLHVVDPVKCFESLRQEIETGPGGPRARLGALQSDLWKLKAYFSDERRVG